MIRRNWLSKSQSWVSLGLAVFVAAVLSQQCEASTVIVFGGDPADGWVLPNNSLVVGATNIGNAGAQTLQGVPFPKNASVFAFTPGSEVVSLSLGASADDNALEELARRFRFNATQIGVTIDSLTAGQTYRLDLVQSVGQDQSTRQMAIHANSIFQGLVTVTNGNNSVAVTTFDAVADINGEIFLQVRPSAGFGGGGPQDGAVLSSVVISSLEIAVPEPSTYALGLIGLVGLGLVAWRKRARNSAE